MSRIANRRRLRRDELEEIGRDAVNTGLVDEGPDGPDLRLGTEQGAADEALQVRALVHHAGKGREVRGDAVRHPPLLREPEQGGRIASCHPRYDRFFLRHVSLFRKFAREPTRRDDGPATVRRKRARITC